MLNYIVFSLVLSRPSTDLESAKYCCINHPDKPESPLEKANYDCSSLEPFGKKRCNQVYGGNVCKWVPSGKCGKKECSRLSKYELHYGKYIDVGVCGGLCKEDNKSCNPNIYTSIQVSGT
jgi:hypothetical protein